MAAPDLPKVQPCQTLPKISYRSLTTPRQPVVQEKGTSTWLLPSENLRVQPPLWLSPNTSLPGPKPGRYEHRTPDLNETYPYPHPYS